MNIPSMDGEDKVVTAGKSCRIVPGLCYFWHWWACSTPC
jgi:hypothetical protein